MSNSSITPAQAVNNRFQNEMNRAEWGEQNGTMTRRQENRLNARDARIENRADQDEAANGGQLTGGESQRLETRLNNVSNSIYGFNQGQYPGAAGGAPALLSAGGDAANGANYQPT